MDQEKVVAIRDWSNPKTISKLRSFNGLSSQIMFVPKFSTNIIFH